MFTKRFFKTKDEVEVTFEIDRSDVDSVDWYCEATDWQPVAMQRAPKGNGPFKLKVRLPKDSAVQFRYLLDGSEWENDEAADDYWPNEFGTDNSVVLTRS